METRQISGSEISITAISPASPADSRFDLRSSDVSKVVRESHRGRDHNGCAREVVKTFPSRASLTLSRLRGTGSRTFLRSRDEISILDGVGNRRLSNYRGDFTRTTGYFDRNGSVFSHFISSEWRIHFLRYVRKRHTLELQYNSPVNIFLSCREQCLQQHLPAWMVCARTWNLGRFLPPNVPLLNYDPAARRRELLA